MKPGTHHSCLQQADSHFSNDHRPRGLHVARRDRNYQEDEQRVAHKVDDGCDDYRLPNRYVTQAVQQPNKDRNLDRKRQSECPEEHRRVHDDPIM